MNEEKQVREIERARAAADAARQQMLGVAHTLQARLMPSSLADEAWDTVREKSAAVAQGAARAVAKRPAVASVAALGLVAAIAHKPIARLIGRLRGNDDQD